MPLCWGQEIEKEVNPVQSLNEEFLKSFTECQDFKKLSDRLLCFRKYKKKHRDLINAVIKDSPKTENLTDDRLNKIKSESFVHLEKVY